MYVQGHGPRPTINFSQLIDKAIKIVIAETKHINMMGVINSLDFTILPCSVCMYSSQSSPQSKKKDLLTPEAFS